MDYSQYAPEFEIYLNDNKNSYLRHSITNISVSEDIGASTTFNFTINDKFDSEKKQFLWFDTPDIQPGNNVSISMGYPENIHNILAAGRIDNITTTGFSQGDNPTLTVTGYDITKDWLKQKPNVKEKTTDEPLTGTNIITMIADKFKLKKEVDKTKEFPTRITQESENTYGQILQKQADNIGWNYYITREKIGYINPRKNRDTIMTLEWGKNLIQFTPNIDTSDIVPGVKIKSSSPTSNESIIGESKVGDEETWDKDGIKASEYAKKIPGKEVLELQETCDTIEEAEIKAKAKLNLIGDNLVTGDGLVVGTPELEIGQMIQLEGLGKRFSGKYFLTKITNVISAGGGYTTSFSVRKNTLKEI